MIETSRKWKKKTKIKFSGLQSSYVLFTQVWWGILSGLYSKVNGNSLKSISAEDQHKIYIESLAHCDLGLG